MAYNSGLQSLTAGEPQQQEPETASHVMCRVKMQRGMNSRVHACDQPALSILTQLRTPCTESTATHVDGSSTSTHVI